MAWFALDDQGAFHSKVLRAGNEAYGAFCRAGQWCSQHLTDGRLPKDLALTIAPLRIWQKLIDAGLIERVDDDTYQIHDFLDWNPSAQEVRAQRAKRQAAGRLGGEVSGRSRRSKAEANAKQEPKQTRSNDEASASDLLKQTLKQTRSKNEAKTNPDPSPSEEKKTTGAGARVIAPGLVREAWLDATNGLDVDLTAIGKLADRLEGIATEARTFEPIRLGPFSVDEPADLPRAAVEAFKRLRDGSDPGFVPSLSPLSLVERIGEVQLILRGERDPVADKAARVNGRNGANGKSTPSNDAPLPTAADLRREREEKARRSVPPPPRTAP